MMRAARLPPDIKNVQLMLMMCIARAATAQLVLVMGLARLFCDRQYRADADDAPLPGIFPDRQYRADADDAHYPGCLRRRNLQLMLMMHTTRACSFQALPN